MIKANNIKKLTTLALTEVDPAILYQYIIKIDTRLEKLALKGKMTYEKSFCYSLKKHAIYLALKQHYREQGFDTYLFATSYGWYFSIDWDIV